MKITDKRAAATEANKTWKALGEKGKKRIDKAQPSSSRARPSPSKAKDNDKKVSSPKAGSSKATQPSLSGRCSFCKFRAHSPINNGNGSGSEDNRSLVVEEVEKIELFKEFMTKLGYLGSGDEGLGEDEDVRHCEQCGQVMDYVWDRYKESVMAIRGLLDKVPSYEGEENHGGDESEMTAIVVKEEEEFDEDISSYQEDVGEHVREQGFESPQASLSMETESLQAEDPVDKGVGEHELQLQIVSTTSLLRPASPLAKTVLDWEDSSDSEEFLKCFENGKGRKIEVLSLRLSHEPKKNLGLVKALFEALKNNWAPSLKELSILHWVMRKRKCNDFYEDCDLSKGLENLKVLTVTVQSSTLLEEEEDVVSRGFPVFVKDILRGARNLEQLILKGPCFPETSAFENMNKDLKSLHLDLDQMSSTLESPSSLFPELQRVLLQVSTHCLLLEDLRLDLPCNQRMGLSSFPKFPQLKQFCLFMKCLPFVEGDLIRFLNEKMPALRYLAALYAGDDASAERGEFVLRALHSSSEKLEGLELLCIGAPADFRLLEGVRAKFPSLKVLLVNATPLHWTWERKGEKRKEDRLAELGVVVAREFPSVPASIAFINHIDEEKVREKFLEKTGPQFKGTVAIIKSSPFGDYSSEIRLIPDKKISG